LRRILHCLECVFPADVFLTWCLQVYTDALFHLMLVTASIFTRAW
jgi:hypothetical protein